MGLLPVFQVARILFTLGSLEDLLTLVGCLSPADLADLRLTPLGDSCVADCGRHRRFLEGWRSRSALRRDGRDLSRPRGLSEKTNARDRKRASRESHQWPSWSAGRGPRRTAPTPQVADHNQRNQSYPPDRAKSMFIFNSLSGLLHNQHKATIARLIPYRLNCQTHTVSTLV
jgi:hypothetical protein